jgi:hypothetical protein
LIVNQPKPALPTVFNFVVVHFPIEDEGASPG